MKYKLEKWFIENAHCYNSRGGYNTGHFLSSREFVFLFQKRLAYQGYKALSTLLFYLPIAEKEEMDSCLFPSKSISNDNNRDANSTRFNPRLSHTKDSKSHN